VPADGFVAFELMHRTRATAVLAVLAPIEIVATVGVVLVVEDVSAWLAVGSAVLLVAIWSSTLLFFAPLHMRLSTGFDPAVHRRLVSTNWLRTVAWSLRGAAAVAMVVEAS
jgi:hypothetical protein